MAAAAADAAAAAADDDGGIAINVGGVRVNLTAEDKDAVANDVELLM